MMFKKLLLLTLFQSLISGHGDSTMEWLYLQALPSPLSDMTATVVGDLIYLAGGCNSTDGNKRDPTSGYFSCGSVTNQLITFDPKTGAYDTTLPAAPTVRFRHAATAVGKKLVLIGGRDVTDTLVSQIDVYDTETKVWATAGSLSAETTFSDLGAFTYNDEVFFAGGYDATYTATGEFYKLTDTKSAIDTAAGADAVISVVDVGNLGAPRGDVHVVVSGDFAYISGGFTHENDFCYALNTVEKLDLNDFTWTFIDELAKGRGDKAFVALKDHLYAIGGETVTECYGDPLPIDDVEVLDLDDSSAATWTFDGTIPADRFRFVATAYGDEIYTFGGQKHYRADCDCYPTSDMVVKYASKKDFSSSSAMSTAVAHVTGILLLMGLYF